MFLTPAQKLTTKTPRHEGLRLWISWCLRAFVVHFSTSDVNRIAINPPAQLVLEGPMDFHAKDARLTHRDKVRSVRLILPASNLLPIPHQTKHGLGRGGDLEGDAVGIQH